MPQVAQAKTAGGALDQIDAFLSQVSSEYQKTAAESQQDKPSNTPAAQAEPKAGDVSTSQRGLGKEQTDAAEASGSTVNKVPANTDADNKQPGDGKGDQPQQSSPGEGKNNTGNVRHQETVQEKVARTVRLGNAILTKLASVTEDKTKSVAATVTPAGTKVGTAPKTEKRAAAAPAPAKGEKEAANAFFQKCAAIAEAKAIEYRDSYLAGIMKRAQDEAELANVDWAQLGVTKEALDAVGGPSGLLDKIAAEDPMAIMPEGMMGADPAAAAMGADPAAMGAAPAGGPGMDQAADALAAAGVEPQDIEQAAQALNELFQSGVSPEEAAQAVSELVAEQGGGDAAGAAPAPGGAAPMDMAAAAAPAAAPAEPPAEAAAEGEAAPTPEHESSESPKEKESEGEGEKKSEEKEAAEKQAAVRMNVIKAHLRGNLK